MSGVRRSPGAEPAAPAPAARGGARALTRRRLLTAIAALVVVLAAVPLLVYGVVPLFVRSTLVEPPLQPSTPAAAAPVAPAAVSPGTAPATPPPAPPAVTLSGELQRIDTVHYGSGPVTLSGPPGGQVLRFEGVAIAGAPNMFVYLSDAADGRPGHYTDLGPLKATDGSFNYPLPAGLDLGAVHSVVVWCRAFNVTVTFARLS